MSNIIAWMVRAPRERPFAVFTPEDAEHYRHTPAGLSPFTVTPLVAAPPAQTVEEVRGLLWDFANEVALLGRGVGDSVHAAALQSRILASVGCAAPPEGAPTYAELAGALDEAAGYLPHFAAECRNSGRRHESVTECYNKAPALLSRIPKVENTE